MATLDLYCTLIAEKIKGFRYVGMFRRFLFRAGRARVKPNRMGRMKPAQQH